MILKYSHSNLLRVRLTDVALSCLKIRAVETYHVSKSTTRGAPRSIVQSRVYPNNIHHLLVLCSVHLCQLPSIFREARKYMEIERHRGTIANEHITIGSSSYEKVKNVKYLGSLGTNQNSIQD